MWEILVKIYVEIFVPQKNRTNVKYRLLGIPNRIHIKHKAGSVGKNFTCSNGTIKVNRNTHIGNNVGINGLVVMGTGDVIIGNNCIFGTDTLIITSNHNYEGTYLPFDETYIHKKITIGDFVWCGTRVTILPGTTIGEGAIIQAGSVVHGTIPPYAIIGGNPATVFKYRNKEHFEKLKKEGRFSGGSENHEQKESVGLNG